MSFCVNARDKVKKAGGVSFNSTVPLTKCSEKMAQMILHEYSIHHSAYIGLPCSLDVERLCCGCIKLS